MARSKACSSQTSEVRQGRKEERGTGNKKEKKEKQEKKDTSQVGERVVDEVTGLVTRPFRGRRKGTGPSTGLRAVTMLVVQMLPPRPVCRTRR